MPAQAFVAEAAAPLSPQLRGGGKESWSGAVGLTE